MKGHPLRRTAQIASCVIAALICLQVGGTPGRAEAGANPVVIRYLNDRGYVPPYEIADALGFFKDKGIRFESEGDSPGGPESLAALASGSIDVAGAATPAMINAIAGGAKILCIMPRAGGSKNGTR